MAGISPVGCVKEIGNFILTECIQPPVKRHIDYWWCFDNNIKDLRDGVRDLERQIHDLEQRIERARQDTKSILRWVEEWLNHASHKFAEAETICLQYDNIPKAWNITSRYSMGKTAKKTAEEIVELGKDGNFDTIADDAPPAAMKFASHRSTMDFESRKHIEEEIIEYLRSSSVSMIGICGMGGVGKTTIAKRIGDRVKKELFDEVVMVTVSKQNDSQIQEDIAESLKLKFDESESRMPARADKLRTRLMDPKRKIIIFDDVWESLKFEHLGIPFESDSERCKVLLTSRSKDTFKGIQNKKVFELNILKEEEAWDLFKEKAGECVEDSTLLSLPKDVAAECRGLPIALVTVGMALQGETNKYIWIHSLSQLRQAKPTDIDKVLAHVYMPLKLSYDYLDNDSVKNLFLLCCLFPEDHDIPVEQLTFYSMGLRLFDGIGIEEARNKTHTLVQKLKSRFLLIDGWNKLHVRMHDVVRDVAIYIGSTERNGFLKSLNKTSIESSSDAECHWMSMDISNEQMEILEASRFPNLRLLMLLKLSSDEFSNISFQGMENLNVLSFPRTWVGSLPPTLGLLKNLQTLCLFGCEVGNISVIGELTSLEILSCNGCKKITELPAEIGKLNRLRLLELNGCYNLRRIPFGILSSLVRLEELKMLGSFDGWEAEENGKEMKNASLKELEPLLNLTCLEIDISDPNLAAQEIRLPPKLVKYRIYIASRREIDYEKEITLNLPSDIGAAVGNWIRLLVRKAESLTLEGDGSNNFNIAECENLRNHRVFSTLKKLVETKDCKSGIVLPFLERLELKFLENLEEICDGTIILNQNVSFCNLKSIEIYVCHHLRFLFSVSVARRCLLQLEVLDIHCCDAMEQLFMNEITDDDTDGCIEFPMLKTLKLVDLPNLTAFCQGLQNFPNLAYVEISRCSNLRSLFSVSMARRCLSQLGVLEIKYCDAMEQVFRNENRDDTNGCIEFPKLKKLKLKKLPNLTAFYEGVETIQFPQLTEMVEIGGLKALTLKYLEDNIIWCHQIPINFFKNLERLEIHKINGIRNLMSYSVAENLVSLKLLSIRFCEEMVEVIESDDKEVVDIKYLFPTLNTLIFYDLPKLRRFWQWNNALELPLLEEVYIFNCHSMETFTSGSLNTPNIIEIMLCNDYRRIFYQKDLNRVIRQHRTLNQDENEKKDVDEKDNEDENGDKDENVNRDGSVEENKNNNNAIHHFTIINQDGDKDHEDALTRTSLG